MVAIWLALQSGLRQLEPDNQVKVSTCPINGSQLVGSAVWTEATGTRQTGEGQYGVPSIIIWSVLQFGLGQLEPDNEVKVSMVSHESSGV